MQIECEPEYFMEEFGTNPDIDEKPPIPLRDALEKMKPFLMAYEGIQSQEEWEVEIYKLVPVSFNNLVQLSGAPNQFFILIFETYVLMCPENLKPQQFIRFIFYYYQFQIFRESFSSPEKLELVVVKVRLHKMAKLYRSMKFRGRF